MIKALTTKEILGWEDFCLKFETALRTETDVFSKERFPADEIDKRWQDLHSRIIEYNIRIIAGYYTKIRLERMAELLNLPVDVSEASVVVECILTICVFTNPQTCYSTMFIRFECNTNRQQVGSILFYRLQGLITFIAFYFI